MCESSEITRELGYIEKICIPDLNKFSTVWSWSGNLF